MARRSDHTREELYDLAMEAARATVEADGHRALTARTVAEAIGYSPGTLYNLFENLDDMILHLNGQTLEALHDRLAAAPRSGDPAADLMALLDGYLGYLGDHPNLWALLFDYTLPEGRDLPAWYARKVGRGMALVEAALAPLFGPAEHEARGNAARVIWAGLHGICSLSDTGKLRVVTTQPVREMAKALITHFVAGLRAERGGRRS